MEPSDPRGYQAIVQSWPPSRPCHGLTTLPLARPTRVVLAADPPAEGFRDLVIAAVLGDLEALSAPADCCPGPSWLGCWATQDPGARNLMAVVANDAPPSSELEHAVRDWVDRAGFEAIGVIRADMDPNSVLPSALRSLNALVWHDHPLEVVPEIIDTILLDAEDRRIFVSYARADGSIHAERIFDLLARARFDVFLDRFQIPPGQDFIERIEDEIVDKAMIVVIETDAAARSHWVHQEVAIAAKREIGIVAFNLDGAPEIPGIDEDVRFRGGDTAALRSFLLEQHRTQLAQRRESIRESVWQALLDAGAAASDIVQTAPGLTVQVAGRRRLIGVSVRPADLHRFRVVAEEAAADEAFLVHPPPAMHRRRRDLAWLSGQSGVVEVDVGRVNEAASTMAAP